MLPLHRINACALISVPQVLHVARILEFQTNMARNTLVYWHGIVGIPGKGPNWSEKYEPDRTIGELVQTMTAHNIAQGKCIKILKFSPGRLDKYDTNDMSWDDSTRLAEYLNAMGLQGNDVMLVFYLA